MEQGQEVVLTYRPEQSAEPVVLRYERELPCRMRRGGGGVGRRGGRRAPGPGGRTGGEREGPPRGGGGAGGESPGPCFAPRRSVRLRILPSRILFNVDF